MPVFSHLALKDYKLIREVFDSDPLFRRSCDFTAGTAIMWRHFFKTEYALKDKTVLFKSVYFDGSTFFIPPSGYNKENGFIFIGDYCRKMNIKPVFRFVTEEDRILLEKVFPQISFIEDRDWFDYIYRKELFENPAGRKYHKLKNLLNRFMRENPDYQLTEINNKNSSEILEFLKECGGCFKKESTMSQMEFVSIAEMLKHWDIYSKNGMTGMSLSVNGKIIGMTAGEVSGDTLFVHVEKAKTEYPGAYQILSQGYMKSISNATFVNREEDMGDEGLRRSKTSYNPEMLLKKYTAVCE